MPTKRTASKNSFLNRPFLLKEIWICESTIIWTLQVIWYVTPCSLESEGIVATLSRLLSLRSRIIFVRWLTLLHIPVSASQCRWQGGRCFEILIDWCVRKGISLLNDTILLCGKEFEAVQSIYNDSHVRYRMNVLSWKSSRWGQFILCGWYESLQVVMCSDNSNHSRL
jgi:hypothetical protein